MRLLGLVVVTLLSRLPAQAQVELSGVTLYASGADGTLGGGGNGGTWNSLGRGSADSYNVYLFSGRPEAPKFLTTGDTDASLDPHFALAPGTYVFGLAASEAWPLISAADYLGFNLYFRDGSTTHRISAVVRADGTSSFAAIPTSIRTWGQNVFENGAGSLVFSAQGVTVTLTQLRVVRPFQDLVGPFRTGGDGAPDVVATLTIQVAPVPCGVNLLRNPEAEEGAGACSSGETVDAPGWQGFGGATAQRYDCRCGSLICLDDPGPPDRGRHYFFGGPDRDTVMRQSIDLLPWKATIDRGALEFLLRGYLGGYEAELDSASVQVTFRDAIGTELGTSGIGPVSAADRGGRSQMMQRSIRGNIPRQARTAEVAITFDYVEGNDNDGYADALEFAVFGCETTVPNKPPTVSITEPKDGTSVEWGKPLSVTVVASDPDDRVARIELSDGGAVVGRATVSPWVFVLTNLTLGAHSLTARASDTHDLTAGSVPVSVEVSDPLATVAIVGLVGSTEVKRQREYLLAMDRRSRVFAPDAATFANLVSYQLVIWCGAGREGVSAEEVATLVRLRDRGTPLYFIGEALAGAARDLPELDRARWQSLTRLVPVSHLRAATAVELLPERLQFVGFAANSVGYSPPGAGFESALGDAEGQVLGRSGEAVVLMAIPRAGEPDLPTGYRSVTQNFFAYGAGTTAAQAERQFLFQDFVCWLLRCHRCAAFNLVMEEGPTSFEVAVGAELPIPIAVYQRYACVSTGVQFDGVLPPELELTEWVTEKGFAYLNSREAALAIGQMNADERLSGVLKLRALAPGSVTWTLHLRSHESGAGGEDGQRTFSIRITGDAPAPRLQLERVGANVVVSWPMSAAVWVLESSSSVGPGAVWSLEAGLPTFSDGRNRRVLLPSTAAAYFRLRRASQEVQPSTY